MATAAPAPCFFKLSSSHRSALPARRFASRDAAVLRTRGRVSCGGGGGSLSSAAPISYEVSLEFLDFSGLESAERKLIGFVEFVVV